MAAGGVEVEINTYEHPIMVGSRVYQVHMRDPRLDVLFAELKDGEMDIEGGEKVLDGHPKVYGGLTLCRKGVHGPRWISLGFDTFHFSTSPSHDECMAQLYALRDWVIEKIGGDNKNDAEQLRMEGNTLFRAAEYGKAIEKYTQAVEWIDGKHDAEPTEVVAPLLNRAMCRLKQGAFDDVVEDTTRVLSISPTNIKALFRRSRAYAGKGLLHDAKADLLAAQAVDPTSRAVESELIKVAAAIAATLR